MFETCTETVSILTAILFGADGACVEVSLASMAPFFVLFLGAVVILQWIARRAVAELFPKRPVEPARSDHLTDRKGLIGRSEHDSGPVRSTRG